jgi:hypothetical protein
MAADISSTSYNMGMFLMKQGMYSNMYVPNVMHGLLDIRIFRSLVPKESPCSSHQVTNLARYRNKNLHAMTITPTLHKVKPFDIRSA